MTVSPIVTAAGAWVWDKYSKSATEKTSKALKAAWEQFRWKDASLRYRRKMSELHGTMQIMGMTQAVPLEDIFTDVYLLDKPTAYNRFDIEHLKQLSSDPTLPPLGNRLNGLRLVVEGDHLFILGKPGAGKTTFLKYIVLKAAETTIDKTPIFVSLKRWSDSGLGLLDFISEQFDICDFPDAHAFIQVLLKSGDAIVLFDGLDEVNQQDGHRDVQIRQMANFIDKYGRTQCLITCRIAATDYSFQRFTYVEVADFTQNQVRAFVSNWFRKDGQKDLETCAKFLSEFEREDNKGLQDLARTPLLLTLLCLAFNETLTFPQRRVEIYEEAVDALLKKWDSTRRIRRDEIYRRLSLGHKENMLARIAVQTFEKNEYFIPQNQLETSIKEYVRNVPPHSSEEEIDGSAILKSIEAQHGIFVERARKVYSFSHLTFQEYFTAKFIVANVPQSKFGSLVRDHFGDHRWREVLLLVTSLLPDAGRFMSMFLKEIDNTLEDDTVLFKLLKWADEKAGATKTEPRFARPQYLWSEIRSAQSLALLRALKENERKEEQDSETSSTNDGVDANLELDISLSTLCHFMRILNDKVLPPIYAATIPHAIGCSERLGLTQLAKELRTLPINSGTRDKWRRWANKLRLLMLTHRNMGRDWNLSRVQEDRLTVYIQSTRLLEDCLELAFMPPQDKTAILQGLYLPQALAER